MTTGKCSSQLQWALRYARMDLPVFPCKVRGKKPLTPHGFNDATTDLQQVREWWRRWPKASIGMATGTPSGLIVLDIDPRNGGKGSWAALRWGRKIPKTAQQWTGGGGMHIFFRNPGDIRCGTLRPGLDVKAEGAATSSCRPLFTGAENAIAGPRKVARSYSFNLRRCPIGCSAQ